jgi:hypothetical protein
MSINVVVSSTAAGVSVSGGTAVAISVSSVNSSVPVTVGGGIGPAGFVVAQGTATNAFGTFNLSAGDGITISTSVGQFQIASYGTAAVSSLAPVQSVAGRVGTVQLQASDVTAGTFAIARIPTISYTALANVPATFTPSAHTHSTSDMVSFTAAAAAAAPVQSVAGRSGAVTLAKADVGLGSVDDTADASKPVSTAQAAADAAVQAHAVQRANHSGTQPASSISDFAAEAAKYGPVVSVAGRTGAVSLAAADVAGLASVATSGSYTSLQNVPATFAPAAHTHSTADITGITASFAAASHTHSLADLSQSSATAGQVPTWNGSAWAAATPSPGGVTSVAGRTGTVTLAQLASSGTASSTTFLRGDGAWAAAGSTDAGDLVTGTLSAARLPLATTTVAGAVIVGSGLTIASGVLSRVNYDPADAPGAPSAIYISGSLLIFSPSPGGVAVEYEVQRAPDGSTAYTTLTKGPFPSGFSVSTISSYKHRVRGFNADGLAGEWGYQEGAPGGSSGGGTANIVEAATAAAFPATGASGTLYITDTSRIYRWVGSVYVELGPE